MNELIPLNIRVLNTKEEINMMLMNRGKLILICDETPEYLSNPMFGSTCIKANNLLPNYEAVGYILDKNIVGFQTAYCNMLSSEESTIYIITIISALMNNIPIGLIFGNEEIEQQGKLVFLQFLENFYGLHIAMNSMDNSFMYRQFMPKNMSLLYQNNLLTPQEFLYVYPNEAIIDSICMQKLVMELRPPINPTDIDGLIKYFDNLRRQMKQANKVLEDPVELC